MSRFDVTQIVFSHFGTLRNFRTKSPAFVDLFIYLVLPLILSTIIVINWELESESVQLFATFFSIFAALLFNLLLLVFDLIKKSDDKVRNDLLLEVFANISFDILVSVICLVILLVFEMLACGFLTMLITFIICYLSQIFVLTLLMILKRINSLLAKEIKNDLNQ